MVDGMFCAACAASLEHRLQKLPAVTDACVDLAAGAALVRWKQGGKDAAAAGRAIAALGYTSRRPDTAAADSGAQDPYRSLAIRLVIALFFGMWVMLPSVGLYLDAAPDPGDAFGLAAAAAIASLPVIGWAGLPFYSMAWSTLRAAAPGVDALVTLGVIGAVLLSLVSLARGGSDVYFEVAVTLITLQLLARLIELRVARGGRDAMARLLDLAPPRVLRSRAGQAPELVPVSQLVVGDTVIAEAGETLALDGEAETDGASLDRHLLSGETGAVSVRRGTPVHAGEVVLEGPLRMRVTSTAGRRRVDDLARQVRALIMQKPAWQRGVDVIARYFLLLATVAAGCGALLAGASGEGVWSSAERALAVFVIACPCALSLAAPLAGLGAARSAAGSGVLLRDLRAVTRAGHIDTLFVDKTGTLTEGRPAVSALYPQAGCSGRELLAVAAAVELESRHPFARAILDAAENSGVLASESALSQATPMAERRTVRGAGVRMRQESETLRVGSEDWFAREGLACPELPGGGLSRVWVARGREVLGAIDLDDPLRPGVAAAVGKLRQSGISVTILSGDAAAPVARIARQLGIRGVARCSPEEKVQYVEAAAARGEITAFVGDGLNDGPAIAAADLGVAISESLDAARTASAATLLKGGVERMPEVLAIVASARRILRQNIIGAIAYNAFAIPAALIGVVHPAIAAVAMALSSITVVLNSQRVSTAQRPGQLRPARR